MMSSVLTNYIGVPLHKSTSLTSAARTGAPRNGTSMNVEVNVASVGLRERLIEFRDRHIYPNETEFNRQVADGATRWKPAPLMEELRARARAQGLWNLSMSDRRYGPGLSNAEYAPLAE